MVNPDRRNARVPVRSAEAEAKSKPNRIAKLSRLEGNLKRFALIGAALIVLAIAASAASRKASIQLIYQPDGETGDYRISIYGGRELVCEEKTVEIIRQPTALDPIVLECRHKGH